MKFNPDHIVIDADIARAVGFSEHPVSSSSRAAEKDAHLLDIALERGQFIASNDKRQGRYFA
jgi:hypothetical protein